MFKITRLAKLAIKKLEINNNTIVKDGSKADETVKNLSKSKKLKNNKSANLIYKSIIKVIKKPNFLISSTKKTLNYSIQMFIKAIIF